MLENLTAAASGDLTTLAKAKCELALADNTHDARITNLIHEASDLVAQWCNRAGFGRETLRQTERLASSTRAPAGSVIWMNARALWRDRPEARVLPAARQHISAVAYTWGDGSPAGMAGVTPAMEAWLATHPPEADRARNTITVVTGVSRDPSGGLGNA